MMNLKEDENNQQQKLEISKQAVMNAQRDDITELMSQGSNNNVVLLSY